MMKKEKPLMSVTAIIQGAQNQWARGLSLDNGMSLSMSPQSPLDTKPDTSLLSSSFSPTGGSGPQSPSLSQSPFSVNSSSFVSRSGNYPPNHPLSGSKHLCSICEDRASGKHYGVYSCEGCKGFFKRTVRKDLTYACREDKICVIDKRQRNRCQYCRYHKCLDKGMKREAVQEERQRKERNDNEVESTSNSHSEMPLERILEAEKRAENQEDKPDTEVPEIFNLSSPQIQSQLDSSISASICQAANRQLFQLTEWAKLIPHFTELQMSDQITLLKAGWNELLIAGLAHRSISYEDSIAITSSLVIPRNLANQAGMGTIFDRILTELVSKMRDLKMDKTELGCLKTIILFNPDARDLKSLQVVEALRDQVYVALEEHTRLTYPNDPRRFSKILLRLPALRSIGLKCLESLFFFRLIGDTPIDPCLKEMLENSPDL